MKTTTRSFHARQGFTLIELLTVIAIIGILAAIIIPTVGAVRQSARESKNISNVRQISMVLNILATDNKDKFPDSGNYTDANGNAVSHWKSVVGAYLKNLPSNQVGNWIDRDSVFFSPTSAVPLDPDKTKQPCHYSVNSALMNFNSMRSQGGVIPRSRVKRPSLVILVGDAAQCDSGGQNAGESFYQPTEWTANSSNSRNLAEFIPSADANNVDTSASRGYLRYRNREKAHVGMVDGSARALKRGTVTYGNIIAAR